VEIFGEPDRDFSGYRGFPLAGRPGAHLALAGLQIGFAVKLHVLIFPDFIEHAIEAALAIR
jgi:hypothetical protein